METVITAGVSYGPTVVIISPLVPFGTGGKNVSPSVFAKRMVKIAVLKLK